MFFSIIIPVFNTEQYLSKCLDSILAQSYTDFELLLIDDGSTDCSGKICDEYAAKDSRITVFHVANGGVSRARNIGIDLANGEWVCFVDSDDWVEIDYLQTFASISKKMDITFFPFKEVCRDGNEVLRKCEKIRTNERTVIEDSLCSLKYGFFGNVFGWTFNKFFRMSLLKEYNIRFVEGLSHLEDEMFTMDYCRYISSLEILEKPLYYYRRSNTGLTAKSMQKNECMLLAVHLQENLSYYSNDKLLENDKRRIADYYIQDMFKKAESSSFFSSNHILYNFVKQHPDIAQYASVPRMIAIQKHCYLYPCVYLYIRKLIKFLVSKISR